MWRSHQHRWFHHGDSSIFPFLIYNSLIRNNFPFYSFHSQPLQNSLFLLSLLSCSCSKKWWQHHDPKPSQPYKNSRCFSPGSVSCPPRKGALIFQPAKGKVGVPIPIIKAGLRLPTTDFFDKIMRQYDFSVDDLTPNVVNKIIGFELACGALGVLP